MLGELNPVAVYYRAIEITGRQWHVTRYQFTILNGSLTIRTQRHCQVPLEKQILDAIFDYVGLSGFREGRSLLMKR
jgi:hypothetical protein